MDAVFNAAPPASAHNYSARQVNYGLTGDIRLTAPPTHMKGGTVAVGDHVDRDVAYRAKSVFALDNADSVAFAVLAVGEVQLIIDGYEVMRRVGRSRLYGGLLGKQVATSVRLSAGEHTLELRYRKAGGGSRLKLFVRAGCNLTQELYGTDKCPVGYEADATQAAVPRCVPARPQGRRLPEGLASFLRGG